MWDWDVDKAKAASLMGVWGRTLLCELPRMVLFWIRESDPEEQMSNRLAFLLLRALYETGGVNVGSDVVVLQDVFSAVKRANSVRDASLVDRYRSAYAALETFQSDEYVENVDQILIPALLGGSFMLSAKHAQEVRKHVLSDDVIAATKLLSQLSSRDAVKFPIRLCEEFAVEGLYERLVHLEPVRLYSALKRFGVVGPFDAAGTSPIKGFKAYDDESLALVYARALDDNFETR